MDEIRDQSKWYAVLGIVIFTAGVLLAFALLWVRMKLPGSLPPPPYELGRKSEDVLSAICIGFSELKQRRKDLKLLVCLTGPNPAFSILVSSPTFISALADESSAYLKKFSFDGIDIDWEFPTWSRDAHATDRAKFPLLLKALRQKYGAEFLITLAGAGPPTIAKTAYDVSSFNKYVDLVQVMNYDYHIFSAFFPFVGFNAPLRKIKGELAEAALMNS
ncbi:glycosyl hydrolase, family 18, partial [Oesophagostomum dentatum]